MKKMPPEEKQRLDAERKARNEKILARFNDGATTAKMAAEFGLSTNQINGIIRAYTGKKKRIHHATNICFDCAKACGRCSWSARFEPVPGWTAKPTAIKYFDDKKGGVVFTQTYSITACPEFTPG